MRVQIVEPFEVDTASGPLRYAKGQIVAQGQRNWVDKGLAVEAAEEEPKAELKSADTPKG